MAKSYYAILGISSGANAEEIRAAYRRLVKEFHPDHYSGGTDIFQQIQQAYSILSDSESRRQYDETLDRVRAGSFLKPVSRREPEPLIPKEKPINIGNVSLVRSFQTFTPSFDEIFDWLWSNFSSITQPKSGRVQNMTLEVHLSEEQALRGGNASIMVPVSAICPICRGYGGVGFYECLRCAGEGAITGEVPISVTSPPSLTEDHAVMIPLERFGIRNMNLTILFRPSEYNP